MKNKKTEKKNHKWAGPKKEKKQKRKTKFKTETAQWAGPLRLRGARRETPAPQRAANRVRHIVAIYTQTQRLGVEISLTLSHSGGARGDQQGPWPPL